MVPRNWGTQYHQIMVHHLSLALAMQMANETAGLKWPSDTWPAIMDAMTHEIGMVQDIKAW